MEEASKAKKAKKGFMTPERKKKLRVSRSNIHDSCTKILTIHHFPISSCCYVKKPLRNWRRNKNAKQPNVDVSLRSDVANQRTLRVLTKVFILVYPILLMNHSIIDEKKSKTFHFFLILYSLPPQKKKIKSNHFCRENWIFDNLHHLFIIYLFLLINF